MHPTRTATELVRCLAAAPNCLSGPWPAIWGMRDLRSNSSTPASSLGRRMRAWRFAEVCLRRSVPKPTAAEDVLRETMWRSGVAVRRDVASKRNVRDGHRGRRLGAQPSGAWHCLQMWRYGNMDQCGMTIESKSKVQ